jgi:hypothetical protein
MTTTRPCESCSMPIETGHYCQYCVDDQGQLQPFEERLERMMAFQQRRTPDASRAELEAATLAYMARMPAWRDHPRVKAKVEVVLDRTGKITKEEPRRPKDHD